MDPPLSDASPDSIRPPGEGRVTPGGKGAEGSRNPGRWEPPTVEHLQALLHQYEFIEMLGHGGMGAVYKARQVSLDRLVAVKILPPEIVGCQDANFVERFKNEARTMARMNHPAIVSVHDFGQTAEGQLYFAMEFVDGTDVARMVKEQRKLRAEHALAITAHVCDALHYAHTHGVIHRDIKPANVLINLDGQVKVADFGLAKASDATGQTAALTGTNVAMGTPDYIAPEALISGMPVDHRADLYAVGVMLYNMLTGDIPRGIFKPPSQKVGSDPRFDPIIRKAMEQEREERYQSALDIRRALDVILTTPQAKAERAPQAQNASASRKPSARRPATGKPPRASESVVPDAGRDARPSRKKSRSGMIAGIAGAAAVIGIGAFYLIRKPAPVVGGGPAAAGFFAAEIARLAPDQQAARVAVKLQELNPGFDGKVTHKIEDGELAELTFATTSVADISPVAALKTLKRLTCGSHRGKGVLTNLAPLRGLALTAFSSLGNPVVDLTPLKGMPLTVFVCTSAPLDDLSPLKGMSLTDFACNNTQVSDLAPLAGMPLKSFNCNGSRVHDFTPLRGMPLEYVNSEQCAVRDLSPLKGAPLATFYGGLMPYSDLTPLAGAPLKWLNIYSTGVSDLSPLRGLPIQTLGCSRTKVRDFSPLVDTPLQSLDCDFKPERDLAILRSVRTLKTINGRPAAEILSASVAASAPKPADVAVTIPAAAPVETGERPTATSPAMPSPNPQSGISRPQSPDPRLAQLDAGFKARLEADSQKPFDLALAALNQSYVANGIGRARAAAQQKGALDEVTALDAERARIQNGRQLPPADLETLPAGLKELRATYRSALAKIEADRAHNAAPLYDIYLRALDAYVVDLTRANKLDDARTVKNLRDDIAAQRPQVDAPVAADPIVKPAAAPKPAGSKPATNEAGSSWRRAAEWVLSVGGTVTILKDGEKAIRDIRELPTGRFEVLEIRLDFEPGKAPAITDEDLTRFSGLKSLRFLRFNRVPIKGIGLEALLSTTALTELVVANMVLDDRGLGFIARCKGLKKLWLERTTDGTAEGLAKLAALTGLEELVVHGNRVLDDRGMLALAELTKLRRLNIEGANVTDEGLSVLEKMKDLTSVNLCHIKGITGPGLVHLQGLAGLSVLDMHSTSVSDDSLAALSGLANLTVLGLNETPISDAGLKHLVSLTKLRLLRASAKGVTGTGFLGPKDLKTLDLGFGTAAYCTLNDEGLRAIATAFPNLEGFDVASKHFTSKGLAHLTGLKNLKSVKMCNSAADDGCLEAISQCPSLEWLEILAGTLRDDGLQPLTRLTKLRGLILQGVATTDASLEHIKTMRSLTVVGIIGTKATARGIAALKQARPDLKVWESR